DCPVECGPEGPGCSSWIERRHGKEEEKEEGEGGEEGTAGKQAEAFDCATASTCADRESLSRRGTGKRSGACSARYAGTDNTELVAKTILPATRGLRLSRRCLRVRFIRHGAVF